MSIAISETAPAFSLPGVDGRDHSLDDYDDARALVLVQSCNHCPYVQAWEGRLIAIQREYAERGVRIVAISSNDVSSHPEDSFEQMQVRAREQGFNFDYLYDESQSIARALGSERTPEVFVFDGEHRLVYHGAPDSDHQDPDGADPWLRNALAAALDGRRPVPAETAPIGCTVKWRA